MERRGGAKRVKYKKLVRDKISQGMADRVYSRGVRQCRVKVNNLKQKYRKVHDGNKITSDKNGRCLRGHSA